MSEQLEKLESKLSAKIDELQETADEIKEERGKNGEAVESLKQDFDEQKENILALQDQVDEMRHQAAAKPGPSGTDVKEMIRDSLSDAGVEKIKSSDKSRASFELDLRTKDIMTPGGSLTGEVIEPTRVPGVVFDPQRPTHVRQIMSVGNTTSDVIRYVEETEFNSNAATVPSDGTTDKPESDLSLSVEDAPVRTIAHTFRVHRDMLSDIPFLQNHIQSRGMYGLMLEEDSQILYGDGTGENLTGISQHADSQFDDTRMDELAETPWNNLDYFEVAANQARRAEYPVNGVVAHPDMETTMRLSKDANNRYLELWARLSGRYSPVVTTAINAGDGFIGSFAGGLAVELYERQGVTVELFREDRDNVPKNLVTIRIEERVALPIYRPEGIIYIDDFTATEPAE